MSKSSLPLPRQPLPAAAATESFLGASAVGAPTLTREAAAAAADASPRFLRATLTPGLVRAAAAPQIPGDGSSVADDDGRSVDSADLTGAQEVRRAALGSVSGRGRDASNVDAARGSGDFGTVARTVRAAAHFNPGFTPPPPPPPPPPRPAEGRTAPAAHQSSTGREKPGGDDDDASHQEPEGDQADQESEGDQLDMLPVLCKELLRKALQVASQKEMLALTTLAETKDVARAEATAAVEARAKARAEAAAEAGAEAEAEADNNYLIAIAARAAAEDKHSTTATARTEAELKLIESRGAFNEIMSAITNRCQESTETFEDYRDQIQNDARAMGEGGEGEGEGEGENKTLKTLSSATKLLRDTLDAKIAEAEAEAAAEAEAEANNKKADEQLLKTTLKTTLNTWKKVVEAAKAERAERAETGAETGAERARAGAGAAGVRARAAGAAGARVASAEEYAGEGRRKTSGRAAPGVSPAPLTSGTKPLSRIEAARERRKAEGGWGRE